MNRPSADRRFTARDSRINSLKALLRHPDPPQLWYQLDEIVESRIYLRHGIEVSEGDVVFDVGANVGVAAAFFAEECGARCRPQLRAGAGRSSSSCARTCGKFPDCIPHE